MIDSEKRRLVLTLISSLNNIYGDLLQYLINTSVKWSITLVIDVSQLFERILIRKFMVIIVKSRFDF